MVCVTTTGSDLERKGLSRTVAWVHLFRQPCCWMVPSKLLSTCLSIIPQVEGAGEEPEPELGSEAICATSRTPWNMCHSCLASLLSALIAWSFCCTLALRDMNWCYFLFLIVFQSAVQIFTKSKHQKPQKQTLSSDVNPGVPLACLF